MRFPELSHKGVTNDKLTFMASGYQSVSAAAIDSALWHGTLNEIIVSSVSASLKFYFTRVHEASLQ